MADLDTSFVLPEDPADREKLFDAYLSKELPPDQMAALEDLLFEDNTIMEEIRFRESYKRYIKSDQQWAAQDRQSEASTENRPVMKRSANTGKNFPAYRILLAAAVAAFLVISLFLLRQSDPAINSDRPLPIAFQTNAYFEQHLQSTIRSEAVILTIHSPKNGQIYSTGDGIIFNWETSASGGDQGAPETLGIVNNRGTPVFTHQLSADMPQPAGFRPEIDLPQGLYYWMLDSREETLYVGKFQIGRPDQ